MRTFFISAIILFTALSFIAQWRKPQSSPAGKTMLTWVTDDNPARREQMALFREFCVAKGRPDIDIKLDPTNAGMDKVVVQSVGGVGPDLFDMYERGQLVSYHDAGILEDLTDTANRRGFGLDILWPALRDAATVDGRQYSMPTNCASTALFYNKDLFDKLGVPYPKGDWTWDEFVETAKRLTRRKADGRGYESYGVMGYGIEECIWQAGGRFFSDDGTKCVLDSPEAVAGARFYHDLQYRHHVMPTAAEESAMSSAGGWGTGSLNYFMGGHIGMIVSGRFAVIQWRKYPNLRIGVAPMPHGREHANRLLWRSTGVNVRGKNKDASMLFAEFLASEPYNRNINSGGDGLSAIPRYADTPEFRFDPRFPNETDNALWIEQMKHSKGLEMTPYASPFITQTITDGQRDLIRSGKVDPETAMKTAARKINALIQRNIERDPVIRERYLTDKARTNGGAKP